jgi:hypothetical protein
MPQVEIDGDLLNRVCVRVTNQEGRAITRTEAVARALKAYMGEGGVQRGETAATTPTTKRGE